jgi:hypothetical protein
VRQEERKNGLMVASTTYNQGKPWKLECDKMSDKKAVLL